MEMIMTDPCYTKLARLLVEYSTELNKRERVLRDMIDVPSERMALYSKTMRPVLNYRVNKTRWVVLRWPTPSMAQGANMSTEAFEDLFFQVCTMDYAKMAKAMGP